MTADTGVLVGDSMNDDSEIPEIPSELKCPICGGRKREAIHHWCNPCDRIRHRHRNNVRERVLDRLAQDPDYKAVIRLMLQEAWEEENREHNLPRWDIIRKRNYMQRAYEDGTNDYRD